MNLPALIRRPRTWLIAVPLLALLVGVVGPFVYIQFVQGDPPARLTLAKGASAAVDGESAAAGIEAAWTLAQGQAGYRVDEVLFGQDTEAVGRTSAVTGALEVDGDTVTAATFTVDMATVQSDESRRDNQFRTRIMDTATYPTATFVLTEPISLDDGLADGDSRTVSATGEFTIRGVTRSVTFDLSARRDGDSVQVNGTIPITFDDFGIPDASFGPASVKDHGEIEFLLTFTPA